jgi:Bacterial Ig-like domain (group 3)
VRFLNLEWGAALRVAALGLAAMGMTQANPGWAAGPQPAPQSTATTLSAEMRSQNGRTLATFAVAVKGEDGGAATGAVVLEEDGRPLAGAALSGEGRARLEIALPAGDHALRAVYKGDDTHQGSVSGFAGVRAQATTATPDFDLTVAPGSASLTAGQSGSATVSLVPHNTGSLTGPMFVTLACAGFPDQSSCTFTPENVEILPNATTAVNSSMVLVTQGRNRTAGLDRTEHHPVAWAVLLPGTLGLAGLAFSARRNRWLSRMALVALVGFVGLLGTTACAPRYNYYNHGPPFNLPTPAGSYTLQITAQSSNGVTATTHTTSFALTVK